MTKYTIINEKDRDNNFSQVYLLNKMHLQWFAKNPEDEGRTEDATERKIKKAREEGKVAKSTELVQAIVLLFCLLTFTMLGSYIIDTFVEMMTYFLSIATVTDITVDTNFISACASYFFKLALPLMIVGVVAAVLSNVMQFGFLFTTKTIEPKFDKIAPNFGKWLERTIFSAEGLFNFGKTIFKITIVIVISYINISRGIHDLAGTINMVLGEAFMVFLKKAFLIIMEVCIFLLGFSIIDYLFQRKQHLDSLKMSKHDVKQEFKESEGDPLVKSRIKQRMRELRKNNMMAKVPDADVVITNPTHYAVALEYKMSQMEAPMVIAKGEDDLAQRIKAMAYDNEIPVIENKMLARGLYAATEIGDVIPGNYYAAILEIYKGINFLDSLAQ